MDYGATEMKTGTDIEKLKHMKPLKEKLPFPYKPMISLKPPNPLNFDIQVPIHHIVHCHKSMNKAVTESYSTLQEPKQADQKNCDKL